jgi:hypothetical protein
MADPRLNPDPPVAHPPEGAGLLQRTPRPPWGAVALQPHPLDPKCLQRPVVGGGAKSAVADHRPGCPASGLNDSLDRGVASRFWWKAADAGSRWCMLGGGGDSLIHHLLLES